MKRESAGSYLSAVFVDYDNIYLSLKRRNEEAARRFAKDAGLWLKEIESGRIITPTNGVPITQQRRIVLNRCYGNPVPRRNPSDNSTDMNSFPFVRHHFLRAGFEIVDCPPLTAQLKNSSDIRMVMDVRDLLTHDTYFDEFVILSGDADFTPVLHRLRAHARRTVIFANDHTAAPYTAISDGEVREVDLATLLIEGRLPGLGVASTDAAASELAPVASRLESQRNAIVAEVTTIVRQSQQPVPLEVLADRAQRAIGHDKTVATGWAGAGSFRELLAQSLPPDIKLTEQPPFLAYDAKRHAMLAPAAGDARPSLEARPLESRPIEARGIEALPESRPPEGRPARIERPGVPLSAKAPPNAPAAPIAQASRNDLAPLPVFDDLVRTDPQPAASRVAASQPPPTPRQAPAAAARGDSPNIHQTIARIHEACQAPPLAPPEYRVLFEVMAAEINERGLAGAQTLTSISQASQQRGINVSRDDVRFVLEVVSEADPWFEQGASANLFAGRFRNFVVARCLSQGMSLPADELDLIDRWFMGTGAATQQPATRQPAAEPASAPPIPAQASYRLPAQPARQSNTPQSDAKGERWWPSEDGRVTASAKPQSQPAADEGSTEEFPRIVRTRLRG